MLLPMIGTIQKLLRTSQQREFVKNKLWKENFVKSDRSLGSNVQETVRGIF